MACSSDGGTSGEPTGEGEDATVGASVESSDTASSTTSTVPAIVVGLAPNLDLTPSECFAEIPDSTTTTTSVLSDESSSDEDGEAALAPTTEATIPETLPETTATVPMPPVVAIVDCAGTNDGEVYAAFCLGDDEDSPGRLTAVACPGDPDFEYPSDRTIRRAAARVCLQRFEELFGTVYAVSDRLAEEFVPTEGMWDRGDRRVVCHERLTDDQG